MAETDDIYEVFAIKYATHARHADLNFIDPPDIHDGPMPIDYFVWLARSETHTVVIDTGFNRQTAEARGRQFLRCSTEGLEALGVDAATVEDVIITHLHYDHVGNFDLFPAATFHLQDREMAFATGRHMRHKPFRAPMDVEHVTGMVRELYRGRVTFHDGDAELFPGLSVHHIGGHTDGLMSVRVKTARGWVVLASDAAHLYANRDKVNPYPIVFRVDEMLASFERLGDLADSDDHVVPGHDPLVMDVYPAPSKDLKGWVVRLDVAPET